MDCELIGAAEGEEEGCGLAPLSTEGEGDGRGELSTRNEEDLEVPRPKSKWKCSVAL